MLSVSLLLIILNLLGTSFADDELDQLIAENGEKRGYGDDCACLSDTTVPGLIALINRQEKRIEKLENYMKQSQSSNDCNRGSFYVTYPTSDGFLQAMCDQGSMGGRWTVIQRRTDGSVDFYRNYNDYVSGFGTQEEYWLGLQHIHELTKNGEYALLIEMTDYNGKEVYAYYNFFMIDSASRGYPLQIGSYQGNAGDSLSAHKNQRFSARGNDKDRWTEGDCAEQYRGGWWYVKCHSSNLNGLYYNGGIGEYGKGINWQAYFEDYYGSFVKVEMKIRKRGNRSG